MQSPKNKPAKSRGGMLASIERQLSAALAEMFPEMGAGQRSMLARQLADEYMRERGEAADSLGPQHPVAPKTEQMEFEEAYGEVRNQEAKANRTRRRLDTAMRENRPGAARPIVQNSPAASEKRFTRNLQIATKAAADEGSDSPLAVMHRKKMADRKAAAKQFQQYAAGKARPVQPQDPGTPYGDRTASDMYWQMVDAGEDPAVAQSRTYQAFRYAPKT